MKKGLERGEQVESGGRHHEDESRRGSAARPEPEARAGASGSDLVILPSNPSSPSAPLFLHPTAFSVHSRFVHPAIKPEL